MLYKASAFVQILSESSYSDEDALYAMYAKKKFSVESIAIDSTGKTEEQFGPSIRIKPWGSHFNDMNHLTRKHMILRIVLRTDDDANELWFFINLWHPTPQCNPWTGAVDTNRHVQRVQLPTQFQVQITRHILQRPNLSCPHWT